MFDTSLGYGDKESHYPRDHCCHYKNWPKNHTYPSKETWRNNRTVIHAYPWCCNQNYSHYFGFNPYKKKVWAVNEYFYRYLFEDRVTVTCKSWRSLIYLYYLIDNSDMFGMQAGILLILLGFATDWIPIKWLRFDHETEAFCLIILFICWIRMLVYFYDHSDRVHKKKLPKWISPFYFHFYICTHIYKHVFIDGCLANLLLRIRTTNETRPSEHIEKTRNHRSMDLEENQIRN